ncbi:MAG: hypothetical protein FJX44_12470 [Alphaproteobacteria bacterium]|nr:hypothetical protein [Alphaproteobacteria bacterium]
MRPLMLEPVRITPPAGYPVTLAEAKDHLHVDDGDSNSRIAFLIAAATEKLDGWNGELGRCLITQTWRVDFDRFPCDPRLDLPFGPVQSVTVKYSAAENVEQTFDPAKYGLHEDALGPFLALADTEGAWPGTYARRDAVRITIVAGYGTADSVPEPIKQIILFVVGHWFTNREGVVMGQSPVELPMAIAELLVNYRYPSRASL